MSRFFASKYPVTYGVDKDNKPQRLPTGTIFTVAAINGNMFELEPVEKISPPILYPMMVDANMLNAGFTGQDHLNA
jgi:hypothetical protein